MEVVRTFAERYATLLFNQPDMENSRELASYR